MDLCQVSPKVPANSTSEPLYDVPTAVIVVLSVFYGSVSVIAVLGNGLVLWILCTSRR